ncbi:unnamed protein product [Phytomonas sp. Hart1]|nr:unnamed protein product [Phytomonas sp. Hart1]|eukprot:CCW71062.1 unnamed protein product [Phytomonas sp. isolate Hart1]
MSSQKQLHDAIPIIPKESLFSSFSGGNNLHSPVSVDKRFQQDLSMLDRTSPFSASTSRLSPRSAAHQNVPFSVPSTIKVVNHRSVEHAIPSLSTLSGNAFGQTLLSESYHLRSGGTSHINSEAASSGIEENKLRELGRMLSLSLKLSKKPDLPSVNLIPVCLSSQTPGTDPEGEGLTICTKNWSQYTPLESDLPSDDEKIKLQPLISVEEPRSDTVSMLSILSSRVKASDNLGIISARGELIHSGRCAPSFDNSQIKPNSNLDQKHATSSVRQCESSIASLERPTSLHGKGLIEDSPHIGFALASIASARVHKEISNTHEGNVSGDHSVRFMQQNQSPLGRNQSFESSPTNVTLSRVMQNEGMRSSASFADTSDIPHRISFQRGRMIGTGGFGTVYQAILYDGTLAAVKEIKIEPTNLKLIDREVTAMSSLPPHANCVRYLGSRYSRHHYYIIMDYISGGSIASLRQSIGPFRESVFQRYAYMVLLGLHHLHSHNIIHRDIKGANVLLDEHGCAKIVDFGCCKDLNNGKSTLGGGGTPLWMASEVCRGEGATEKSDVWSFGCLCLEMTNETGLPWNFSPGITLQGLAYALACAQRPPPIPTTLSPISQDFIACCLRLDPEERWSVSQLLDHNFFKQDCILHDEEEDEFIVSYNTSTQASVVKRIAEQAYKTEHMGDAISEANKGLIVPPTHHSPAHADESFSNPLSSHFSKGVSTCTHSQVQTSLAAADNPLDNPEKSKGCVNGSSKPVCSTCNPIKDNDHRLQTINAGFRLDVVDDSEDGSEAVKLDMYHKAPDMGREKGTFPSNDNESYRAALDNVIEPTQRARTEERRACDVPFTPTLLSTGSFSGSMYLNAINMSCSEMAIYTPSDTSKTTLPDGYVMQQRKSQGIRKVSNKEPNKTVSSILNAKDSKAEETNSVAQDTGTNSFPNNISIKVDSSASTSEKHSEKKRSLKNTVISSSLHDPGNLILHKNSELYLEKGYHTNETKNKKDNTVLYQQQQDYTIATLVSTPFESSKGQSFSTENHVSANSLLQQQPHLHTTPNLSPTGISPMSKLVWSTHGSGSISKDVSGVGREASSSVRRGKSSKTKSPALCENQSINGELVTLSVLQTEKKRRKFPFKWFRINF